MASKNENGSSIFPSCCCELFERPLPTLRYLNFDLLACKWSEVIITFLKILASGETILFEKSYMNNPTRYIAECVPLCSIGTYVVVSTVIL